MLVVATIAAIALGACTESAGNRTPGPTVPTVTAQPSASGGGWEVLFDGTATSGLRGYGSAGFPDESWVIEDGRLGTVPGVARDLVTDETFVDFELEFTWRVAPGGNSGVLYRVEETADPAWTTGPEYQILDDGRHPDGRDERTSAAAVYGLLAPAPGKVLAPVGSDNDARIVVRAGRVEHWLNGAIVAEYTWGGPEIRERITGSKFEAYGRFMAVDDGHVVFQHHGEEAAFGLIRIRRLPPAGAAP